MAVDDELRDFVRDALTAGRERREIAGALTQAGWGESEVEDAMSTFADTPFTPPVPRPTSKLSARDAFLYLLMFSSLGLTAWYFGSLMFDLIDAAIADPLANGGTDQWRNRSIRWAVAALIPAFPLYLWLARKTEREAAAEPRRRKSPVRRWLTYMTLFLAAVTILGDVMALIYQFLNGDLTIRVLLKIAVVGVIAAVIFSYYLKSAQRDEAA